MQVKNLPRYETTIALGLRKRYSDEVNSIQTVYDICQEFVGTQKTCVTITPTEFVYPFGNEPGVYIKLINYPRFPSTNIEVFCLTEKLATILMDKLDQERCSVMSPSDIYLYENPKYL